MKLGTVQFKLKIIQKQKLEDKSFSDSKLLFTKTEEELTGLSFIEASSYAFSLNSPKEKIKHYIKISFYILIIYFSEELYFLIANNHILDRIIVNMRNFGILTFLLNSPSYLFPFTHVIMPFPSIKSLLNSPSYLSPS